MASKHFKWFTERGGPYFEKICKFLN